MDKKQLSYELKIQRDNLTVLQECLKNITFEIQNTDDFENPNDINELLKEVKLNLDNCRNNITNLLTLEKQFNNTENNISNENESENFNNLSTSYTEILQKTSSTLNEFLLKYIKKTSFVINKEAVIINADTENIEQKHTTPEPKLNPKLETQPHIQKETEQHTEQVLKQNPNIPEKSVIEITTNKDLVENLIKNPGNIDNIENITEKLETTEIAEKSNDLQDNRILLISEKKNKIFLPYTIKELNKIIEHNRKYTNLQEIINKRFTLPLDRHKNSIISRFKETYNFMRKKEKASITDSLDFALELAFNSKLNPAVILACKNLEELDAYLDCLELDELNKFDYFEIQYEFSPTKR